jgi:hypothetical protein
MRDKYEKAVKNRIKEMPELGPVTTSIQLRDYVLSHVGPDCVEKRVWDPNLNGKFKHLLIGGYGDSDKPYGAGPTRPIDHATYALRVTGRIEQVPLITGVLGKNSPDLERFLDAEQYFFGGHRRVYNHQGIAITRKPSRNFSSIASGDINLDRQLVNVEMLVSNVQKQRKTYSGDLIFSLSKYLGSGLRYMSDKDHSDENLPHTRKTLAVLRGETPIGRDLRVVVSGTLETLNKELNDRLQGISKFGIIGNYLTVDNV